MARKSPGVARRAGARAVALTCLVAGVMVLAERPAHGQGRDGLLNGAITGGAVGAGAGVAFTHAVRDSDLTFGQYMRGALIFGTIGAGAGIGVDALFDLDSPGPGITRPGVARPRVFVAPAVWRDLKGVVVLWRW